MKTSFFSMLIRRAIWKLTVVIIATSCVFYSIPLNAEGGIAMSGSFYQQAFSIPQGSSISGPDVYVVVFNNSGEQVKIRMTGQTPPGVRLVLSQSEFTLPASGQMRIQVGVEVSLEAVPGEYEIFVIAEPYKDNVSGIQLTGAASQKAALSIVGESGTVSVQATSPDGQPITAMLRLFRNVSGQNFEVSYSETGSLTSKLAPGSFTAISYIGGEKLAEEKFTLQANENKIIRLSGATVYFEGFGIVPNYQKQSGELSFVQMVYTVRNLYQRLEKGEVILEVSRDDNPLEDISLVILSPLEIGRAGLNYNYIPAGGWTPGKYGFKLHLKLDDKPYTSSQVEHFMVAAGGEPGGIKPVVIGVIAAVVIIAAGAVWWFTRNKKRA